MSLGGGQNLSNSFMEGSFANPRFIRDPISICNYARPVEPKQLDEGIDDTLVSVDAMGGVGRSTLAFIRLRSYWAKEASTNRTGAVQAMYSIRDWR